MSAIMDAPRIPMRRFALFAYGFRPFFLLAALDAMANMAVWLCAFLRPEIWPEQALPAMYWHAHEMLFGFIAAAIGGFLLTAVPGWTGRSSYSGVPLISLTVLWLAGRLAMAPLNILPATFASIVDLSFFPALMLVLAPPLIRARKFRNLPFLGLLAILFCANLSFHLGVSGRLEAGEHIGLGVALDIIVILIVVVGGRIIPAFTKGGLARHGIKIEIQSHRWIELASILSILAVLASDILAPLSAFNGAVAIVAALAQIFRLAQWQGYRTARDPLIWVLHLGYAWLILGLLLKSVWLLTGAAFTEKWVHALTVGAFATMILAVMTRASLGHTGRALIAPRNIATCYALISVAAIIRVFAPPVFPSGYGTIILISGLSWIAAFGIFLWVYTPMLARPRADGRPG